MTVQELLDIDPAKLAILSDEQLAKICAPLFPAVRTIAPAPTTLKAATKANNIARAQAFLNQASKLNIQINALPK